MNKHSHGPQSIDVVCHGLQTREHHESSGSAVYLPTRTDPANLRTGTRARVQVIDTKYPQLVTYRRRISLFAASSGNIRPR